MKAILSDIHGNLEALQAVLEDIEGRGIEQVICLGDVVGYGPNPRECLELVAAFAPNDADILILGNHEDAMLSGTSPGKTLNGLSRFNASARRSVEWTRTQLWGEDVPEEDSESLRGTLGRFRETATDPDDEGILYVHGSPRNPVKEYVTPRDSRNVRKMETIFEKIGKVCFAGHTHVPGVFAPDFRIGRAGAGAGASVVAGSAQNTDARATSSSHTARSGQRRGPDDAAVPHDIEKVYTYSSPESEPGSVFFVSEAKSLVNVGSVGQPRDGDPRACYVTFDMDTVLYHRVEYDVEAVVAKVWARAALDNTLGERLRVGR